MVHNFDEVMAMEHAFEREIARLENTIDRSQKSIALYKAFLEDGASTKEEERMFGQYVRHNWSMSYEDIRAEMLERL